MNFKCSLYLFVSVFVFYSLTSGSILDEEQILTRGVYFKRDEPVVADISFCIADLKFDGKNLKICEFGEGCHSKFRGFDRLYGKGKAWELFWVYLSQFKLPIWYVGVAKSQKFCEEIAYDTLVRCGGDIVGSFMQLENKRNFLNSVGRSFPNDPTYIADYKAIVCVKTYGGAVKKFMDRHPNVLVLDIATSYYVNSKLRSTLLFNDDELLKYRPKFWLLKRCMDVYFSDLYVRNIVNQINATDANGYSVIKPVCGTMGRGIFMTANKDLHKVLSSILKMKSGKIKKSRNEDTQLSFWTRNKSKYCLVEEFVKSKTIEVEGNKYDPTMRVFFALCFNRGVPEINVLGAYWKLPPIALNEKGKFVDKHKSHIIKQKHSSWPVDHGDLEKVTEIMQQFMPRIYANMIFKTKMPDEFETDDDLNTDIMLF